MKLLGGLILWLVFSLAGLVAIPVLLFGVVTGNERIWSPVGRAMDRVLAVLLGYPGRYTTSAELAVSDRHQWLRKLVDTLEPGHCEKEARKEGLIQ
jgi:hypothetical protein